MDKNGIACKLWWCW